MRSRLVCCWCLFGLFVAAAPVARAGQIDPILEWNLIALDAAAEDCNYPELGKEQPGPTRTARGLAMVHAAMFDAANSIVPQYQPYLIHIPGARGASLDAAVARAAHDVLVALYPRQTPIFDEKLAESLGRIRRPVERMRGQMVGAIAARIILWARQNDGSDDDMPYEPGMLPGDHRADPLHPDQGYLTPLWGKVTPFAITSPEDFPITPPPPLDSPEYSEAYNEVKEVGRVDSELRTEEQEIIGVFWAYDGTPGLGAPPRLYNQIVRVIAEQQGNGVLENARLFALVNLAMADAGIACWNDKYRYSFWRPIVGIREADPGTGPSGFGDGNPDTEGEIDWEPYGAPASNASGTNFTPPFPACGSGHATFGASALHLVARFYGTDEISFDFTSDEFNGITTDQFGNVRPVVTRHYDRLSDAIEENGQSRIYLGIHWRFDKTCGIDQGTAIADAVFDDCLKPRRPAGGLIPGLDWLIGRAAR